MPVDSNESCLQEEAIYFLTTGTALVLFLAHCRDHHLNSIWLQLSADLYLD